MTARELLFGVVDYPWDREEVDGEGEDGDEAQAEMQIMFRLTERP